MVSRREKFSSQPEELPLELPARSELRPALDMDQYRAFGSVPRLLGSCISTLEFEQLGSQAWERTSPSVIEQGLFGREGGTAVNGLVLGAEFYQAIIRNHESFLASIHAKTAGANRQTRDPRAHEKLYRSQIASLVNKHDRHENIIGELEQRQEALRTLEDMQRTPGYHKRISEVDVRIMATTAWESVFMGMLRALKDHYELSNNDMIEMERALSYRLLKADNTNMNPQNQRIANWGEMLQLGSRYTRATKTLFSHSKAVIESDQRALEERLDAFYLTNGIMPLGTRATRLAMEPNN